MDGLLSTGPACEYDITCVCCSGKSGIIHMIPTFNSNFIEDFVKRVKYIFCIQFHTVNSFMFLPCTVCFRKKFPNWFSFVPFSFRSLLKHRSLSVGISLHSVLFSFVPSAGVHTQVIARKRWLSNRKILLLATAWVSPYPELAFVPTKSLLLLPHSYRYAVGGSHVMKETGAMLNRMDTEQNDSEC